jgi:16S rRNA G966 N2-methylase RsmD
MEEKELGQEEKPVSKQDIAWAIKPITEDEAQRDFEKLRAIGPNASNQSSRCRVGNQVVDRFTFAQRLETRGKYNVNFYEFVEQWDTFRQKTFIKNMHTYYATEKNKSGKKNRYVVLKEIYNICISAINIIRPLVYMDIYTRFGGKKVLDFCAGWGGAAVAAAALNLEAYIGVEINRDLKEPYQRLIEFLKKNQTQPATLSATLIDMRFEDAVQVDYATLDYDLVFTSPPYYFIQKYANNPTYSSKDDMDERFYRPLFEKTRRHLKPGGHYILNVNSEVYNRVCVPLWGPATSTFPYKKSQRQNAYEEMVYVW